MRKLYILLFIILCAVCTSAQEPKRLIFISESGCYSLSSGGGSLVLSVFTNKDAEWQIHSEQDWIIIKKKKGKGSQKVRIKSLANKTGKTDEGVITITCGDMKKSVTVKRYAKVL